MPPHSRIIASALITTPLMAAARLAPRAHPTMLTISATGGARNRVSPPRAENGEPHPGRNTIMITSAAGAASDSQSPTRPACERG